MNNKLDEITQYISKLDHIAVAFSGGVDSTFLAYVAQEALGENAVAITIDAPYIPRWEIKEAKELAARIGIKHEIIEVGIPKEVEENPSNRCYVCKKIVFGKIIEKAKSMGIYTVADGTNYDDLGDYRPGLQALKELEVKSPLLECKWTKQMIRETSKEVQLPTFDKPAYACLLTRIPHQEEVKKEILDRIEKSEVFMMGKGFKAIRVRAHGEIARIEVAREDRERLFDVQLLDEISETIKSFGFKYVAIEASGYQMGSLNSKA